MEAQVKDVGRSTKMRYNANNDEIEYQTNNGNLALLKEPKFGDIFFSAENLRLKLVTYNYDNSTVNGYLVELVDNPMIKIYKREHINFYKAKEARSSYETPSPAKYKKMDPVYFIQKDSGEIIELPTNKRKLIALFPDKKEAITQYFKNNKGDYSNIADLEKLAEVLK